MIPEHRPTRLPVFLASALSKLYSVGINHKNSQYDRGIGVRSIDRPVISIGNLSAGGTGKTPLVQHIVRHLSERGHYPVVAMRGYKAKHGAMSDEQREHAQALPGVPIVAQPDRFAGLEELFGSDAGKQVDCVVLDDGFQHRKLARDLDVVVIDVSRAPEFDALLPLGFLREERASLARADCVVLTHAELIDQDELGELRSDIETWIQRGVLIAVTEHHWESVHKYEVTEEGLVQHPEALSVEVLSELPVSTLTGIGNPDGFVNMAKKIGAEIVHRCDRPDHEQFATKLIQDFCSASERNGARAILMTRKDWARFDSPKIRTILEREMRDRGLRLLVPSLGLCFRSGRSDLDALCLKCISSFSTTAQI
ncbi:MAG: tetraacyldisaccharide 4'-kinase [Phycisphaerales bacterium]